MEDAEMYKMMSWNYIKQRPDGKIGWKTSRMPRKVNSSAKAKVKGDKKMIKSIAAAKRAELELRRLNAKASAYYQGTDGFTIYEENGEYILEYFESNNDREFKSFDELERSLTEMYEDYTAEVIADEFKELYQGWNDDRSVRMKQAAERYHKAEKIVELYNELYANDWTEDTILKDHENGYLTINDGRDGNEYAWYGDELKNKAVNLTTGEVIDGEKIDEVIAFYQEERK